MCSRFPQTPCSPCRWGVMSLNPCVQRYIFPSRSLAVQASPPSNLYLQHHLLVWDPVASGLVLNLLCPQHALTHHTYSLPISPTHPRTHMYTHTHRCTHTEQILTHTLVEPHTRAAGSSPLRRPSRKCTSCPPGLLLLLPLCALQAPSSALSSPRALRSGRTRN